MESQKIKNKTPFDRLDQVIKNWIQSDSVFKIIIDLNKELGCYSALEFSVISRLIVSISLGEVKPENLIRELAKGLPFLENKQIETATAILKKKVFYPLGSAFKKQGIDIEKISTTMPIPEKPKLPPEAVKPPAPVAREVKFETPKTAPAPKPAGAPVVAPPPADAKAGWQPTPAPKAREMEFTRMNDVEAPVNRPPVNPLSKEKPKVPTPVVNAPEKPFGLSETQPKAPEPHEVVKYQDEHPMKEE